MHLLDFTTFYPPHVGGVEAYAAQLHHEWIARGQGRVSVVTSQQGTPPKHSSGLLSIFTYPAVQPVTSFAFPRPGANAALFRELIELPPVDVVVSHTRFYPASMWAGRVAKRLGARWVHIEHGGSSVRSGGFVVRGIADLYDATVGREIIKRADQVIAVSEASAAFAMQLSGRQCLVAPRGFTLPLRPWVEGSGVLFVGRLVDSKGICELLEATIGIDVPLDIVGDGPLRAQLERETRAKGRRVTFHGPLGPREVEAVMRRSAVLCHPSHTEGLPTVVLEGAALGMPIVATDVGGTSEIIQDACTGWLVPAKDSTALRRALLTALEQPALSARMGCQARQHVKRSFSWSKVLDVLAAP